MDADDFNRGVEFMKEYGWVGKGKVLLRWHADLRRYLVFDGWQRMHMAMAAGITPPFEDAAKVKPKDMSWEEFAEALDDVRRHSLPQAIRERRERSKQLRAQGMSFRDIAKETGASEATARRDAGASGDGAPETVKGSDRKTYKARGRSGCEPGEKKPKVRSGTPKFPWKNWDKVFGDMVRFGSDLVTVFKDENGSQEHKAFRQALDSILGTMTGWMEKIIAPTGQPHRKT
jgi:hypothetical protein